MNTNVAFFFFSPRLYPDSLLIWRAVKNVKIPSMCPVVQPCSAAARTPLLDSSMYEHIPMLAACVNEHELIQDPELNIILSSCVKKG